MNFLLLSLAVLALGGTAALAAGRRPIAGKIGAWAAIAACLLALYPTLKVLLGLEGTLEFTYAQYPLPIGQIILTMDRLSALFLLPTLIVTAFCANYGMSSFSRQKTKKNMGSHWFFFCSLLIGLILLFIAADAFLFMLSWEIMSLSPFFLIIFNDEEETVKLGAWYYLIAAHLGAFFLLGFFIMLSSKNGGSLDFATFAENSHAMSAAGLLFIFALIGFGTKTGLMPLHIWLPEAHPAAPTHISAVMSGVMLNTGIYGIMRSLTFLGASQAWWSYTLFGIGAFTAVLGVLYALTQSSIKRSLAYSSVENMGLICMGLGLFLYSVQTGRNALATFCLLGAMVHMFNHSLYKSLLFLVAGKISQKTGSDLLNRLGGLQKTVPLLGLCFFVAAASICALPPLNGFAGKFIMFTGYSLGGSLAPSTGFVYWGGLLVLALVSGLSLLCFTRIYGIAFLGNPRSDLVKMAREPDLTEKVSLFSIVGLCFVSAFSAPFIANVFTASLEGYAGSLSLLYNNDSMSLGVFPASFQFASREALDSLYSSLVRINYGFAALLALILLISLWRKMLLKSREVKISPTWDCGYAAPTARIQYTGGGFAQPAIYLTRFLLRPKAVVVDFISYFPGTARSEINTPDWMKNSIYTRLFLLCSRIAQWAKRLQHGRVNTYILYILITLVVLLVWKIR